MLKSCRFGNYEQNVHSTTTCLKCASLELSPLLAKSNTVLCPMPHRTYNGNTWLSMWVRVDPLAWSTCQRLKARKVASQTSSFLTFFGNVEFLCKPNFRCSLVFQKSIQMCVLQAPKTTDLKLRFCPTWQAASIFLWGWGPKSWWRVFARQKLPKVPGFVVLRRFGKKRLRHNRKKKQRDQDIRSRTPCCNFWSTELHNNLEIISVFYIVYTLYRIGNEEC